MSTLWLCGAGNSEGVRLAQSINRSSRRWDNITLLDDDLSKPGFPTLGVPVAGPFELLRTAEPEDEVVNLVARTTAGRRAAWERIRTFGVPCTSLIADDVDTAGTELAADVIVYQHATLGPETQIGAGSVAFMGAVIGHESVIGGGCVIASNAVLNARVQLGEGVYVGSNASILPEVRVGAWATIGAGSLVLEDVPPGHTVLGVPAEVVHCAVPQPAAPAPDLAHVNADELEALITQAWSVALGHTAVGHDVNFFDAGGTSLKALQMRERLQQTHGIKLAVTDVYRFPTVAQLARHLLDSKGGAPSVGQTRAAGRLNRLKLSPESWRRERS